MNPRRRPRFSLATPAVVVGAILSSGWRCAAAPGPVPVLNAGFEAPDPARADRPLGWGTYSSAPVEDKERFVWADDVAHSGSRSVALHLTRRGISWLPLDTADYAQSLDAKDLAGPRPPAVAGHEYILSAWVKARAAGRNAVTLVLRWTNETGWVPSYQSRSFQLESDDWQLISMAATAPEGAKCTVPILQVRGNSQEGTVWFDDVGLVDRTGLICHTGAPKLVQMPDTWALGLRITAQEGGAVPPMTARVSVSRAEQEPYVTAVDLTGGETDSGPVRYPAVGAHSVAYTIEVKGRTAAPYFQGELQCPSILQAEYLSPRYRQTIFADRRDRPIRLRAQVHAADALLETLTLEALLERQGQTLARQTLSRPAADGTIDLALPDEAKGACTVQLVLRQTDTEIARTDLPLLCAEGPQPLAAIGDNNELLLEGKPTFPLGFYSTLPEDFKQFKADGFNTVLTYGSDVEGCAGMGQQAHEAGLKLIVSALRPAVAKRDAESVRKATERLGDIPGIIGYYLWDEPSPAQPDASPQSMRWLYEQAMEADPSRITCTVFCRPSEFRLYADTTDVYLVDPYPTHYGREADLTMVAEWVDRAREAVDDRKPVWLVPQAFDHLLGPGTYRMPTLQEQRSMCYLGLTHGAKGIIWFVYTGYCIHSDELAKKQGTDHAWVYRGTIPHCLPLRYEGIKRIVAEVNELSPVLLSPDPPQTQRITSGAAEIHCLLKSHGGAIYLFAVNAKDRPAQLACELPGIQGRGEVLWEGRTVDLREGTLEDSFKPYEVHVYRFGG